jgi:hypothetical protein
MVTFNVADFARITAEWAAARRWHAGCLLIVGIDHAEFGLVLRVIEHALSTRPDQDAWIGYTAWAPDQRQRNSILWTTVSLRQGRRSGLDDARL